MSSAESLYYGLSVLRRATDNFSDGNLLGQGGFGKVYKGILPNGEVIAVKRTYATRQGIGMLKYELLLVAKLQHRNLVRLRGVCLERGESLLVYEFMPNGSLDKFLLDQSKKQKLDWETRFKIIGGIARGLIYLHEESHPKLIHRDLKPGNVLLDANMKPKIADFGIAKPFHDEIQDEIFVCGTMGYLAPEMIISMRLSTKLDVYSYGVLVLEIVTGEMRNCSALGGQNFLSHAWEYWSAGRALEIVDSALGENYPANEVLTCIHIGLLCVQDVPSDRPSMSSVFSMLYSPSLPQQIPKQPGRLQMSSSMGSDLSPQQDVGSEDGS